MLRTYTARHVRTRSGYTGQVVEWPEVVTEGVDIDECREMLRDALRGMVAAYRQLDSVTANEPCKQAGMSKVP